MSVRLYVRFFSPLVFEIVRTSTWPVYRDRHDITSYVSEVSEQFSIDLCKGVKYRAQIIENIEGTGRAAGENRS